MATAKKAASKKAAPKTAVAKKMVAKKTPQTPRGRAQDRRLVAARQSHEVRYEAAKGGVSPGIGEEVVKAVGNVRKKVEVAIEEFKTKRKPAARNASQ